MTTPRAYQTNLEQRSTTEYEASTDETSSSSSWTDSATYYNTTYVPFSPRANLALLFTVRDELCALPVLTTTSGSNDWRKLFKLTAKANEALRSWPYDSPYYSELLALASSKLPTGKFEHFKEQLTVQLDLCSLEQYLRDQLHIVSTVEKMLSVQCNPFPERPPPDRQ